MTKLSIILDQIDAGTMLLPEFQRGYVWNRDQVRGLMRSLYRDYPVGALLIWETEGASQTVRGSIGATNGSKQLLLDGQQRITTLYGVIRGKAPSFFEGDSSAFEGLRFNVETELFEFYAPVKMKDDPLWIDVTALFVNEPASQYGQLHSRPELLERFGVYVQRLSQLHNVLQRDFHAERITGADKTVDVVVDIFNRVNSGGTKLSKGDLALARICAEWGDARPTMRRTLQGWHGRGYNFTLDWLLRNVNAAATGRAPFSALEDVSATSFKESLGFATQHIGHFLDLISGRLGLDHDRVLMGRYAFPVVTRLLAGRGGRFAGGTEADRALYWYVHSALRGRFAGSTETALAKDLETVDRSGMDGLVASLKRERKGTLSIDAQDFEGLGRGSRSYPLLYLATRVHDARDFVSGVSLRDGRSALQVHEIFPKALLYRHGYTRSEVNAVANFGFLSGNSSDQLVGRAPSDYLRGCDPEALRSQWVPTDPALWELDRYRDFLEARRELLASAVNSFLDQLCEGAVPWTSSLAPMAWAGEADGVDARAAQIAALLAELAEMGFATPAVDAEIADPDTGRVLAVAEVFWADGLQVGQGSPVVLELDPEEADLARLTELGCEVFTSVDALRGYVQRRSQVAAGERNDDLGVAAPRSSRDDTEQAAENAAESEDTDAFDHAVLHLVDRCRTELRYNPRSFRVMISQYGALGAVRRILNAPAISDGFVTLWERNRLDLTAESLVVRQRYEHLFTEQEREVARSRLAEFGYEVSSVSA